MHPCPLRRAGGKQFLRRLEDAPPSVVAGCVSLAQHLVSLRIGIGYRQEAVLLDHEDGYLVGVTLGYYVFARQQRRTALATTCTWAVRWPWRRKLEIEIRQDLQFIEALFDAIHRHFPDGYDFGLGELVETLKRDKIFLAEADVFSPSTTAPAWPSEMSVPSAKEPAT